MNAVASLADLAAAFVQVGSEPATTLPAAPLPSGAITVVRWLLNVIPPWLQVLLLVAGVTIAIIALVHAVRARAAIRTWLTEKDHPARLAIVAAGALIFVAIGTAAAAGWRYVQHDNDFCSGCHVMNAAYSSFAKADNKHLELSCHSCHQQSIFASTRQLYLWIADRPEDIGPHSKVRNRVCESCHVTGDTARWQRVASTAGHRVHLQSDSSALKDVQCVTCHGVEIHRFRPTAETCNQSGCHDAEKSRVQLGRMEHQTVRHCTSCHGFTAEVPALATADSARGTLVPGEGQCLGCHEMREVMRDFDPVLDPHGGQCGSCHAPHTQRTPAEAANTCGNAGCHADWRKVAFHTGPSHRGVATDCTSCHAPHRASTDASDCQGCHLRVRSASRRSPPIRFDTIAARLRAPPEPLRVAGEVATIPRARGPAMGSDFPHDPHQRVACLSCHETGDGHGGLTFETPRGCQLCHHESGTERRCTSCHVGNHAPPALARTVTIAMPDRAPVPRSVRFEHARHETRTCTECHSTVVSRAVAPDKAACDGCHVEHHAVGSSCTSCHTAGQLVLDVHRTPGFDHRGCDGCHTKAAIQRLTPTRAFCATCHVDQRSKHYEPRECSTCHFMLTPTEFSPQLLRRVP